MASIAHLPLEIAGIDPHGAMLDAVHAWARPAAVALRDAVILLPFVQQLAPARVACSRRAGWAPRIETTQTLARSLIPAAGGRPGRISYDVATDRLAAAALLRPHAHKAGWARRDAQAFDHAVAAVVETAHALAKAAAAVPPDERSAYWDRGRATWPAAGGPGANERLLARVALEWAALAPPPATDVLFGLSPSAWVVVRAGGSDPLADALITSASARGIPCCLLDADPTPSRLFDGLSDTVPKTFLADGFEAEAQATAAQVLRHLQAGEVPVALVAQDRVLVRRVRALLERQAVRLADETGWKLSTTRAAAAVASLLRASAAGASPDDVLDWLKASCLPSAAVWTPTAVDAIEAAWRRHGWRGPSAVDATRLAPSAQRLWTDALCILENLGSAARSLADWRHALAAALNATSAGARMQSDEAGRQVWQALGLGRGHGDADGALLDAITFRRWVDDTFEAASFMPKAPPDAQVVITPLRRTVLRTFGAVVFPATDDLHLGRTALLPSLVNEAQAEALGIPTTGERQHRELLAFAHLVQQARVTLLRRRSHDGQPLAASRHLERLRSALSARGLHLEEAADPREVRAFAAQPALPPAPSAPDLLPSRLSASACEALRACPYRFYALRMLGLQGDDELDEEVAKRDYGTWLHAVLLRFHVERAPCGPRAREADAERLQAAAAAVQAEQALDPAEFLPYAASFKRFTGHYLDWLQERDAHGAVWVDGELALSASPPAWAGIGMHGVIDRVDSVPRNDGPVIELIDYKTGSVQALRTIVKTRQEDTQLAFYAALMAAQSEAAGEVAATYLALDDSKRIQVVSHPDVEFSAGQLVAGIGRDLVRLRHGVGMPALGEGALCEHCDARGLCRRDHWSGPPSTDT